MLQESAAIDHEGAALQQPPKKSYDNRNDFSLSKDQYVSEERDLPLGLIDEEIETLRAKSNRTRIPDYWFRK